MQNFAAIGPFGAEIWRGVKLTPPPPPSKNLLSKSPVKIGLNVTFNQRWFDFGITHISARPSILGSSLQRVNHNSKIKCKSLNVQSWEADIWVTWHVWVSIQTFDCKCLHTWSHGLGKQQPNLGSWKLILSSLLVQNNKLFLKHSTDTNYFSSGAWLQKNSQF